MEKKCIILMFWSFASFAFAQSAKVQDASAVFQNDTLTIENALTRHRYLWNDGDIMLLDLLDKRNVKVLQIRNPQPDLLLPGNETTQSAIHITTRQRYALDYPCVEVEIRCDRGSVQTKRLISVYPETPAVRHVFYFKGKSDQPYWELTQQQTLDMIEYQASGELAMPRMGIIPFASSHWKFKAVSFREATDHHDNPVEIRDFFNYRQKERVTANVMIAQNKAECLSFFVLKESPIGESQAYFPGFDFQVDHHGLTVHGLGVSPEVLSDEWVQGYGFALGLTGNESWEHTADLIQYQKRIRKFDAQRDGMVLANTWGDRSKDSRMTEAFILSEIDKADQLGITHLQLDDGWQKGLSRNSASKSGLKWDDWTRDDWKPHPMRFPRGLDPIVVAGREKNIEICLWFNPSKENSYAQWERDADILIDFYERYAIKVFKIDGMSLADKVSEINLRKLFDKVMQATAGEAVFNMDVTAGNRVGYHFFQEYGNVFLENRYTDWANYYPHRTLRNLWQLSAYMPAERLQIEFLNVFRNQARYPEGDTLAPHNTGMVYALAATMLGQPLAWMELSNLIGGETELASFLQHYHELAPSLHSAIALPIGDEPDGFSWTGFQIVEGGLSRYLVMYRENTGKDKVSMALPMATGGLKFLWGDPPTSLSLDQENQVLNISFSRSFSFAVFALDPILSTQCDIIVNVN